jgi:quercetin dioxygenase-like cupin family protein
MNDDSLFLAETLPQTIMTALGTTPKRLLFRNDCVQLVLVGLSAGQELKEFAPGTSLLMVVTHGRVMVRTGNRTYKLLEGEQYQVLPTVNYEVRALEATDLLFFIPARQQAQVALPATFTPQHEPALAAA